MYKFKLVPPGYVRVTTVSNNIYIYKYPYLRIHILFTRITVCNSNNNNSDLDYDRVILIYNERAKTTVYDDTDMIQCRVIG